MTHRVHLPCSADRRDLLSVYFCDGGNIVVTIEMSNGADPEIILNSVQINYLTERLNEHLDRFEANEEG